MKTETGEIRHVIIGNSVAAVGAIEAMREVDRVSSITVISNEPYHVYSRPMIPKILSGSIKSEGDMNYRDGDFYVKNNVKTILGKTAVKVDVEKKQVMLEDNTISEYDKLLIATGGTPVIPEIKGYDCDVMTFVSWNDAKRLRDAVEGKRKCVVVGAGLIGLKAAESLKAIGKEVTVIELADRVLSAITDEKSSAIMKSVFDENGVRIITKNSVQEIVREDNRIVGVLLKDGMKVECDVVVLAIGVRPNIGVVKDSGINVNRGIVVDRHMMTNVRDVYAAGDVAEAYDLLNNENRVIPIWPNAYIQGSVAGYNMVEVDREYKGGYIMNSIEFYGTPIMSFGQIIEGNNCEVISEYNPDDRSYKKIVVKENKVVGAILVNRIERAGVINSLIRDNVDVSCFKKSILDDNFGLIMLPKRARNERMEGKYHA